MLQRISSSLLSLVAKFYVAQAAVSVVKCKVWFYLIPFLLDALCNDVCLNFPASKRHTVIPKYVWFSWCQSISRRYSLNKFSPLQFHRDMTRPVASQHGWHNLRSDGSQLHPAQGTVPQLVAGLPGRDLFPSVPCQTLLKPLLPPKFW